ncbi:CMP-3-deoxy-D-manno-octulosonate--lipid A tetraacyldisaccharide 3-deoxy-D-manno-octulosonate transferase [Geotalea daltonii FRC-32]|uniref:3-deoxy-D-manno-octulosonic acid transferase n=1 Tax=Geotalea daltonii (strain DSM 22248 / JCM 15807 / FRC-32) TaxID=316067 RepID=B9M8W4_GEODF|nr:3-deoxy-D-manno-octulosonic acid transferase [Geotalea daltonii]ACM20460.1 CMP-3-deoxy-D-manno-octulosonate--lipid A tetraacyldisaccharide 3-deoxy-D-manno-octulosonate transferase [Geotalea daltonii FRC-32]
MIIFLYNLLAVISIPFVVSYHLYRSISRGRKTAFTERFGFIPASELKTLAGSEVIWLHAVSVGETIAAVPLVKALRQRYPRKKIVVSNVTETGREVAQKIAGVDLCIYFPFDYPFAVARALNRVRPSLVLIMETEIWPNFIRKARALHIPVVLVNGRISDRSFRRYLKLSWFFGPVLRLLSAICMQSGEDARRIQAVGALPAQVQVTRNLKYDISVPTHSVPEREQIKARYCLPGDVLVFTAGSTHEGEEAAVIAAYKAAKTVDNGVIMVLAPRHPERARQVAGLLAAAGISYRFRSALHENEGALAAGEVLLVDTIGELLNLYAVSDVVFVGGSLVPTGGHNVLEPAALSVPVIFGPHMDNFREISALVLAGRAGIRVADGDELAAQLQALLKDNDRRRQMGTCGAKLIAENSGSADLHCAVIQETCDW